LNLIRQYDDSIEKFKLNAMKIAFPLLNENELAVDFAHSLYIGIYDSVDSSTVLIPIADIRSNPGVTLFFDEMVTEGLQYVASQYFSYMTLRVFRENDITALKANSTNLQKNIQQFNNQMLKPFDVYESLMINECAKNCSSCGSSCS
jgi:hypothetical protein